MSSQFGQIFRISTWGESHGGGVGVVIDGCPPLIELSEADIQRDLDRRRPGQSEIVTPRAVPMVEAMAALVLCDHALRQRALCGKGGPSSLA